MTPRRTRSSPANTESPSSCRQRFPDGESFWTAPVRWRFFIGYCLSKEFDQSLDLRRRVLAREGEAEVSLRRSAGVFYEGWKDAFGEALPFELLHNSRMGRM